MACNAKRLVFLTYLIIVVFVLTISSWNTLANALSGRGYLYIYSLEHPARIFSLFSILLRIFKFPLVAEVVLYYFLLTVISAITIYFMLLKLVEVFRLKMNTKIKYLAIMIGSLIYVFHPRTLIVDVGPSFLILKAILPILLFLSISTMKRPSRLLFKYILAYSSLLALGYIVIYDPRLIIHSLILTLVLMTCLLFALNVGFRKLVLKVSQFLFTTLIFTLLISFPRLYADILLRTMPIGAGIAFVRDAFLYTWSTYLTSFMDMPAFLYPSYKQELGIFIGLLTVPALMTGILLILNVVMNKRLSRTIVRFLLLYLAFFVIFLAFFSSPSIPSRPPIVDVTFSGVSLWVYQHFPLIKYFFILLRAPRLLSDFLRLFYAIISMLFIASIFTVVRGKTIKVIAVLLLLGIVGLWLIPVNGNALIFNVKAIEEAKYYDYFLSSIHGNTSTSLSVMLYHGSRPGGYLIKYIYPVKPYWRADGTIANFIYEYIREKIYTEDLYPVYVIMKLYGFRYLVVNTINDPDKAVSILDGSKYFDFLGKTGPFYIFSIRDDFGLTPSIREYAFVVGGLETYMKFLKTMSIMNSSTASCAPLVPVFDDSWGYNIDYAIKNAKIIVLMNKKNLLDLTLSYIILNKRYDLLIIPSAHVYQYDPLHQWSPVFPSYPFHGTFPYFYRFPAPYTWEYGYNPRYGFIWTEANGATLTIKFHLKEYGNYIFLTRYLVTPKSGEILVKLDDKQYTIPTHNKTTCYSYLKVVSIGPIALSKGSHILKIVNVRGFNMVNLIAAIKYNNFKQSYEYMKSLLRNKPVIHISLEANNAEEISALRSNISFKLNMNNYIRCDIQGIFYRTYVCKINGKLIAGERKILVLPELYGILKSDRKYVESIPVMYVLQGFSNLRANEMQASDVRIYVFTYEWISFYLSLAILTILSISSKIMLAYIKRR